jgi:hypothetical protein
MKRKNSIEIKLRTLDETRIYDYAFANLLLSTLSSLAGIFSAYSTYQSYSSILTENPTLTAAIVMISFQAFFAGINVFVMLYMMLMKLTHYPCTKFLTITLELTDFILEIIIVSLLASVKAEYEKVYSQVLASVVQ